MELRFIQNLTTAHDLNSPPVGVPTTALTFLQSSLNLSSQSASVKTGIQSSYPCSKLSMFPYFIQSQQPCMIWPPYLLTSPTSFHCLPNPK